MAWDLVQKSKLTIRLDTYGGTWTDRKARGGCRITFLLPTGAILDGGPQAVVRNMPIVAEFPTPGVASGKGHVAADGH